MWKLTDLTDLTAPENSIHEQSAEELLQNSQHSSVESDSSNFDNSEGKKKRDRGRPRKNIEATPESVLKFIIDFLKEELVDIESTSGLSSDRKRVDTTRTRLVRMMKKIPYILLVKLNAKGDYKSDLPSKYSQAYLKTFKHFNMAVRATNYYCDAEIPESLEGFLTLYFPDEKATIASSDKDLAKQMLLLNPGPL